MNISTLADYQERRRAAADAVFAQVELEVAAARNAILQRALTRLAHADGRLELEPTVERLARIWCDAWPLGRE